MRVKLFSCHHLQPRFTCNTEIFQTLVSNLPAPADRSFISDLERENIAGENLYAELRHQYFLWKNLSSELEYIGFEHYRRPFFIDPKSALTIALSEGHPHGKNSSRIHGGQSSCRVED